MARLIVITKGMNAVSHEMGGSWVTIGRADGNTFQILEQSISGRHCEVRLQGEDLAVRDLTSTNGTFVGGKKISEAVVKLGETLRLGEVELRFEASAATAGASFVSKMLVTGAAPKPSPAAPKSAPATDARQASPQTADSPAKKFHVLFVDDSMALLETFSELCSVMSNRTWEIYCATTADRALAILQEMPVDLVVLDIGMPLVDGIQLLGIIARRFPTMKIAVLTGQATPSNRATCLANGAELFIEKPVTGDGIKVVFNLLNDLLLWMHREGFSGELRQVGLQEVIQMECNGRHSSILEIRNPSLRGQIYIESGVIVHATAGPFVGEQAIYRVLSLKGGEFQLKPFQAPPERTVHSAWEFLLMEAARASDEETVLITKASVPQSAPAQPAAPKTPPPAAADGQHMVVGDDIVVVATYDGKWHPTDGPKN
jgi:CheY-like chemotaxis protein